MVRFKQTLTAYLRAKPDLGSVFGVSKSEHAKEC